MDSISSRDEFYMRRALQLAKGGEGYVSPNPMVGAVITVGDKIIGEGFHRRFGGPHAEVNAVNSVKDKSMLAGSCMYVSLEPCSHYGKTPPCCNLIINSGIKRVVVGCLDPYPAVSGRGVKLLREAGIEVTTGVAEDECRLLNRRFITFYTHKRPYVLLKWCESSDGFIASKRNGILQKTTLSSHVSLAWMHAERAKYDAIMCGTDTIITDNPSLTVRDWVGRDPIRIAVDRNGRIPAYSRIFSPDGKYILFSGKKEGKTDNGEIIEVEPGEDIISRILSELYKRGITSLMVEGGLKTIQSFIEADRWDEVRREVSATLLGNGLKAPHISTGYKSIEKCDSSLIFIYRKTI